MHYSREDLEAHLRKCLSASTEDTVQNWHSPLVHISGSSTHSPLQESNANWGLLPKFRTGYSMGPFSAAVTHAREFLDENIKCSLDGFEGYICDASGVERYLRVRGLDIPPAANFVTADLDALGIYEIISTKSTTSDNIKSITPPKTARNPIENAPLIAKQDDVGSRDVDPAIQFLFFRLILMQPSLQLRGLEFEIRSSCSFSRKLTMPPSWLYHKTYLDNIK